MKRLAAIVGWGVCLYVFLLPWQTRWIAVAGQLGSGTSEFLSVSVYATDLLLVALFLVGAYITLSPRWGDRRVLAGILAFALVVVGSAVMANRTELVVTSWRLLLIGVLLYWMVQQAWVSRQHLVIAFVAGATLQAGFGLVQFFSQITPALSWLGLAAHDPGMLGTSVVEAGGERWLRAYGSLPHPNILGGYLAVGLLMAFGLYLQRYQHVREGFQLWKRENIHRYLEGKRWYWKQALHILILLLASTILVLGLLLTFSRSAWIGFAVAWVLTLGILHQLRWPWGQWLWFKWSVVMGCIAVVLITVLPQPFLTRATGEGRLEAQSVDVREQLITDARTLLAKHPLRGVGYGNAVAATYDQINRTRAVTAYQPVHNMYLLSLVELGTIGGLVFFALIVLIGRAGVETLVRGRSAFALMSLSAFVCLLIVGLFDHYLWTLSAGVGLWWLVAGLVGRGEREQ
ncbi:MAG: O-antigen ligase family protein [Patescibacteria group bacterium]|jgi:hypothetical protein